MSSILVIAEHRGGELRPVTLELISAAQGLRRWSDDSVCVAVIGRDARQWVSAVSVAGVDEVLTAETDVAEFNADVFEQAVSAMIDEKQPAIVLLPHSVDSMGYAAALAARSGYGFATDVFKIEYQGAELVATRGGYGQKVSVEVDFPDKNVVLVALRPSAVKAAAGSASPSVTSFDLPEVKPHSKSVAYIQPSASDDVDMTAVDFILSVGRGVGEETHISQFEELAERIGANLGCSRPIADSGWLPKSRQIGQSGKTASQCKLYIAMGISGAIQHLAGMKHVEAIVAVNTDPNASIFSVAKYGIVGDMFEIAEELQNCFAG